MAMWHLRYERHYGVNRDEFKLDSFPDVCALEQSGDVDFKNGSVIFDYSKYNSASTILFLPFPQVLEDWPCLEIQKHNHSALYLAHFRKLPWSENVPNDHFQVRFALNGKIVDNRVIGKFVRHVSSEQYLDNLDILKRS